MNDCYARDISEKVKSTLKVKQQNGDFIGTFAPYGYLKDPKDKHKLIIDKDSSIIVRKIFDMILLGKSRKEIADFLNDNNILTPSLYKINKEKTNNEEFALSKKGVTLMSKSNEKQNLDKISINWVICIFRKVDSKY